jgi:hypothetical protein
MSIKLDLEVNEVSHILIALNEPLVTKIRTQAVEQIQTQEKEKEVEPESTETK